MKPADLALLRLPSDVQLHPDGVRVAFVVTRMDVEEDRYESQVWLHDGQGSRPFTHGPHDASPRWSPDGRWLAFVRKERGDDARPQLVVMAADGGEAATRLTDFELGAGAPEWSPDGSQLVVTGTTHAAHRADLEDEERAKAPRRITELPYRADNQGWLLDRTTHVYVVDRDADVRDGGTPRQLTTDDAFREWAPSWHPDGDRVRFHSARHEGRERDGASAIYEVPATGGEPNEVVPPGMWVGAEHAPDGALWATGLRSVWEWPDNLRPFRFDGSREPTDVVGEWDRATVGYGGGRGVVVRDDGSAVLPREDRGRVHLTALAADGGVEVLVGGDRVVGSFDASRDGSVVVCTVGATDSPGELLVLRDGDEQVVTGLNDRFLREVAVAPTTHRVLTVGDGDQAVELDVWTVMPPGNESVPVLLNIHGGPTAQYGFGFFDEFQVYAAAGYGVVATNPRGSSGRGRDWMRAVVGTWLTDAPDDLHDLAGTVDAVLPHEPRLDGSRRGVMGGSYGGFATANLIGDAGARGDDPGWRSAVVERALLSWSSFAGTSDIGPYFGRMFVPAHVDDGHDDLPASGDGLAQLIAASPLWKARTTTTPTLVVHSEGDYRCPVEQADQYFALLRQAGTEAQMLRFPGESHELSRSGSPTHRVQRFDAILDWHARHLATDDDE